ncbi:MAG TPA: hypothetical protein VFJ58_03185 [Armatimonadota bacterium]|nr:hypothetical protein [Armatimonadota bacterium]
MNASNPRNAGVQPLIWQKSTLRSLALVLTYSLAAMPAGASRGVRRSVPAFANLVGVTVGVDTIDSAEKTIGFGKPYSGAHPQGARVWRFRGSGWVLYIK